VAVTLKRYVTPTGNPVMVHVRSDGVVGEQVAVVGDDVTV